MEILTAEQEDRAPKKPVRVTKRKRVVNIPVIADRDPRGADNNVIVWLDSNDHLHIRVYKADRCYRFSHVEENEGYVEVVQT